MIHTHKLNRLSPDEMTVLLYCVNDGDNAQDLENLPIDRQHLSWIKPEYASKMLNQYTQKLKDEKKIKQVRAIADKITNP